jgi:hypothetical protein
MKIYNSLYQKENVVATWLSILNESEIPYARKTKESYPDLFSSLSRLADNCEIKGSG